MAGQTLGTAYVQIMPTATGIKGAISKSLGGEAESAGTSVGGKIAGFAKKALVAAGIGAAVVGGIKASIDEGAKLQQSYLGGLDTLYGEAADAARTYAKQAAAAGISMNDYSEQAVSFGAALKAAYGGDVTKAAKAANTAILDMADNSAKMGTDITSVQAAYQGFAKQNYTMLDNLKLGYGGTKTEMERLLADAEKLSGQTYSIDNLGDVYDAIHVIQKDLGLSGVAAQEASTTFSGSFGAMKAAAQNLMGSLAIGENVEPAMRRLSGSVSTFLMGNLLPMIGTIVKGLPSMLVTLIREGVPTLLTGIGTAVAELAESLKAKAQSITGEKVRTWALTTGAKMLSSAGGIIGKFASGLIKNIPTILASIGRIGLEIVKGLGAAIWPKVTAAANGIKDKFLAPINNLKDKISGIIDRIKGFFGFSVNKPHIPLPHFAISPKGWKIGDLLKGSIPSLGIEWYAEGGIFDKPTVLPGLGEAGPEAAVPLTTFWKKMDAIAQSIQSSESGGTLQVVINMDGRKIAEETVDYINNQTLMFGVSPIMT